MSPIREISPELQEHARRVLGEDPKRRLDDLKALREWLSKQPHIKARPDDQTLLIFLRACKFSIEKAKEKIDMYYTMRTAAPEFFQLRDWRRASLQECLKINFLVQLPELDDQGRRVYLLRGGLNDPNKIEQNEFNKAYLMMVDYIMREDDVALIKGFVLVVDMAALTMTNIVHMTPASTKKMAVAATEGLPLQPELYQIINTPSLAVTFFNLARTFASDSIRGTAYLVDCETMYQQVPKRILPLEYGGDAGPIAKLGDEWKKRMLSYNDWYMSEDGTCGVDEKKRPGKPKTQQELFGIEGSFRKLEFD